MSRKEELVQEYAKWSFMYIKADERFRSLLPPQANLSRGEKLPPFLLTEESKAELARAERDINAASAKLREIIAELCQLP